LEEVAGALEIVFTAAGDTPLTEGGPPAEAVGVIRKGR
jgi:hypothetical protein